MSDAAELDSLAVEELLREAKRGKERSSTMGAYGWKKSTMSTNKTFLKNTLRGVVGGNSRIGKSEDHRLHGTRAQQGRTRQSHKPDESHRQSHRLDESHGQRHKPDESHEQSHEPDESQRHGHSKTQNQRDRLQNKDLLKAEESSDKSEEERCGKGERKESGHYRRSLKNGWGSKEDRYHHHRTKRTYDGHDTKHSSQEYDKELRRDSEDKDPQSARRVRDR